MALHLRSSSIMNPCLSLIDYSREDFNRDPQKKRHPLWITSSHIHYHLYRERGSDELYCCKSSSGGYLRSPRSLLGVSALRIINDQKVWKQLEFERLPAELHYLLLAEAFQWKECHAIAYLISTWPLPYLRIYDVLPLEDNVGGNYLTTPLEGPGSTTLLDWIIIGYLNQKHDGSLKYIDMTGFDTDIKLCSELARLPILWIKPVERKADWLIKAVRPFVRVSKEKLERYITRINFMYCYMDSEFPHGNEFGPIKVFFDCKVITDDVTLGLAMQFLSPFRFSCSRLWIDHRPIVYLPPSQVICVLDPMVITHFEIFDPDLPSDQRKMILLLKGLNNMRNLRACSLPAAIDIVTAPQNAHRISKALEPLRSLLKLSLAHCNLHGHLGAILTNVKQPLLYLNLEDCRLSLPDIAYLSAWRSVTGLRELNLAHNDLADCEHVLLELLLPKMNLLTCFSVAYCSLSASALHKLLSILSADPDNWLLKVLCLQRFTPLRPDDLHYALYLCCNIPSIQSIQIFPASYAFPGSSDEERCLRRLQNLHYCRMYFHEKNRGDILVD